MTGWAVWVPCRRPQRPCGHRLWDRRAGGGAGEGEGGQSVDNVAIRKRVVVV